MESDLQQNHHNLLNQNQMNSSLMRYKSAPSSYFTNFLESEDCEEFLNQRATSPETERSIISRFFSTNAGEEDDDDLKPEVNQFIAPMKVEVEETVQKQQIVGDYSSQDQQIMYPNSNNCNLPLLNRSNSRDLGSAIEGSFRVPASSVGMDQFLPLKIGTGGSNSNLIRQSSSPAGLFSNINIENAFVTTMRGMSNLGGGNVNNPTNGETPYLSSNRMRSPMKFTPGPPSSSGLMSPMPEFDNKNIRSGSPENGNFGESCSNKSFINGFPIGSWDESSLMGENFSGLRRPRDDGRNPHTGLNGYDNQSEGMRNRLPHTPLSHHLSLPRTSNEMAAMEKLLQLEDSVPWKIRAKRGCATHPRSIAERVRRTRISERMRKLQELVPNMDKQTNTADMLDLAVDYIKDLQNEVKSLSDSRSKCTCSSSHNI